MGTRETEFLRTTGTDAGEQPLFPGPATSSGLDRWVTLTVAPGSDSGRPEWPQAFEGGEIAVCAPDPMPVDRAAVSAAIRLVMVTWRAADRELAAILIDGTEWPLAHARLTELRTSYHRLFDEYRAPRPGERAR